MDNYGVISLLPIAVVIVMSLITKKTFESLFIGALSGFVILDGFHFLKPFIDSLYTVLADSGTIWVMLVCGLFGSLIALLEASGGALGFSQLAQKFSKTRSSALLSTWILGIIVFVDDYLNALAVGAAMRKVTDALKISREKLAFIINATGSPVCVLIPFSTWSAFMAGQLEKNGVGAAGEGTAAYIATIPYMFYAWVAVLMVPFVIYRIIPTFGPMKRADIRALETGAVLPPTSSTGKKEASIDLPEEESSTKHKAMNFILPMLVLTAVTIYTEDMLLGVIFAIAFCFVLFLPQRLVKFGEFFDLFINGFKDMFPVLAMIIAAFVLQQANSQLGLTPYVIGIAEKFLQPALLPFIVYVVVAFLAFTTGTFWSLSAIVFPIVIPLAQSMDVNVFLAAGAIISGVVFGAQACLYSDVVFMGCASTQVSNVDYVKTSLPLLTIPIVLAALLFLIFGILSV